MNILQIALCFSRLDGGALIRLLAEDLSAWAEHAVAAGDTGCRNVEVPDETAVIAIDFDNPGVHIIQEPTFDGSANSTTGGS